jgi:16S rRNA processing protein RimM
MLVRVARIGKPFGIDGRCTVQVFTDEPERRFAPGNRLIGAGAELVVESVHRSGARWILGFAGVHDRNAAESLRGLELSVEVPDDEAPAGADEWYVRSMIGLPCRDPAGVLLGRVIGVEHPPAHDLLVVRTEAGHTARIPFVRQIVGEVGPDGLVVDAPGGLLDPDFEAGGR